MIGILAFGAGLGLYFNVEALFGDTMTVVEVERAKAVSYTHLFCPGFRIGWIAGDKNVIRKYVLVGQTGNRPAMQYDCLLYTSYRRRCRR